MAVKKRPSSRFMSRDNPLDGAPWWVKAAVTFGLPAVGLAIVMYWQRMDAVQDRTEIKAQVAAIHQLVTSQQKNGSAQLQVSQRICINTAKSDQQRLECVMIHDDK